VDTSELHALTTPRYFVASECLGAVTKTNNTDALTARSNQLMAHVCYTDPHYKLIRAGRDPTSGTESTNMDESNGTNLKPLRPILFFNKLMKIGLVLVPMPDWWHERPIGTSTNAGQKVLIILPLNTTQSKIMIVSYNTSQNIKWEQKIYEMENKKTLLLPTLK